MINSRHSNTIHAAEATVVDKNIRDFKLNELEQSEPLQLELFKADRLLHASRDRYTRSIEVYDQLAKHYYGRQHHLREATHDGQREVLPDLTREPCVIRKTSYRLKIRPGRVDVQVRKNGSVRTVTRDIYPGPREELVEEVLRKLSLESNHSCYVSLGGGDALAVTFTLRDIERELRRTGHTYSKREIKEALEVCRHCELQISWTDRNGKTFNVSSPIFLQMVITSNQSEDGRSYVVLHPFVTSCVDDRTWRLSAYDQIMSYKGPLTRWLHRRLNHMYTQASEEQAYTVMLSTILRESGAEHLKTKLRQRRKLVEDMLDELTEKKIISRRWKEDSEPIWAHPGKKGGRKTLVDVKYHLYAHPEFASHQRKANAIARLVKNGRGSVN